MSHLPPDNPHDTAADARRVHVAAAEWRKRSRLIHFFRRALPISILVVAAGLLVWIVGKSIWSSVTGLKADSSEIRVTNARFYGQDQGGRSFVLGAREAVRVGAQSDNVNLVQPSLQLSNTNNKPTRAEAARGVYSQTSQQVQLTGGVSVTDVGSGYRFETQRTQIDTRAGVISGDSPVKGYGPLGEISASSYAIYDQGERLTFKGNVRARINARKKQ